MSLADDIRVLRDQALSELVAVHDYFAHTESAWEFVGETIATGRLLTFTNSVTGTVASQLDLIGRISYYISNYLASSTLQQFLAIFESFIGDLLRLWLAAFPRSIGGKTLKLEDAIDAGDLPAIIRLVVDHELAEVTYKSPRKVFEYIERRIGIALPAAADIDQLAEAKATRDVLMHNRGVADVEYQTKAGGLARFSVGQLIEVPKPYHRAVWELLNKLVSELSVAVIAKAP